MTIEMIERTIAAIGAVLVGTTAVFQLKNEMAARGLDAQVTKLLLGLMAVGCVLALLAAFNIMGKEHDDPARRAGSDLPRHRPHGTRIFGLGAGRDLHSGFVYRHLREIRESLSSGRFDEVSAAADAHERRAVNRERRSLEIAGTLAALAAAGLFATLFLNRPLRSVAQTGGDIHAIKHVIIIMQENRSFDTYFGTYPGADGIPMQNGVPTACAPDPSGGPCQRPDHDPSDVMHGGPRSHNNAVGSMTAARSTFRCTSARRAGRVRRRCAGLRGRTQRAYADEPS